MNLNEYHYRYINTTSTTLETPKHINASIKIFVII